ncbi:MAG: hypothetical protein M5R36_25655 [Deltaproteobacteria bacterium]|nr:hypothetical protein [Deltaproteobacteria bacterium]
MASRSPRSGANIGPGPEALREEILYNADGDIERQTLYDRDGKKINEIQRR